MDKFFISEWVVHPSINISNVSVFGSEIIVSDRISFKTFNKENTIYFLMKNEEILKWEFNTQNQVNDALQKLKNFLKNGTD